MLSLQSIKKLAIPLAQKYGIERLFLFGSYARGEATENSDIDFRIDRGTMRGLQFCAFYNDMEEAFNKPLDILTTKQLPDEILNAIKKEEILLYERKF